MPEQPRGKHPGVVDDHQIPRAEPIHQVSDRPDRRLPGLLVEPHQARGAAFSRRLLRNLILGQVEIEVGDVHAGKVAYFASGRRYPPRWTPRTRMKVWPGSPYPLG